MNPFRELRDIIRFWLWDRQMGKRRSEAELWLWDIHCHNGKWTNYIKPYERPRNWPSLLVCLELANSNSDAQRLIKAGAIEVRSWCLDKPWERIDLKTPLPDEPTHIRRGKAVYGIKTIWLPPAGVSQKYGEHMLREGI